MNVVATMLLLATAAQLPTEAAYRAARANHARQIADWRARVAACERGAYAACR